MTSLNLKNCINIPDDFKGYNNNLFCLPKHYENCVSKVLIPSGMIQDRIARLAQSIFNDTNEQQLTALCVLKGGFKFFSDFQDKLNMLNSNTCSSKSVKMSMDFIKLKSYENIESTNNVRITGMDSLEDLEGKNILIVEDIIDTGRTMDKLLNTLKELKPKSIKVACLLRKRTPLSNGFVPDYVGFEIPDEFVVGYALDYNDHFRDLLHICVISKEGIERFRK